MLTGFTLAFVPMHLTGLRGMPRRVFTYPEGLGWDWLNLMSTVGAFVFAAGFLVVVWDVLRPKGREPYARAQLLERRDPRMARRDPGQALGRAHGARDREPLPLVGPEGLHARRRRGPLLSARRRGGRARDPDHVQHRCRARAVPALGGPEFFAADRRRVHRRRFHLPDLPHVRRHPDQRRAGARRDPGLAVDRDRDHPREAGEGRGPRPAPAALRVGPALGRLVGDVHHHARRHDRVPEPGVRLFLLLDGARRLSAHGFARARPVLAAPRPGLAAHGVAFDPSGARLEQARAGTGDAGIASGGSRRSPASVARRCWRAPGSTGSTRPRMSIRRSCGFSSSGPCSTSAPASSCSSIASPAASPAA